MSHDVKLEDALKPHWLNIDQLMQILPLKKSRIYFLTHVAAIPHHKIGHAGGLPAEGPKGTADSAE